MSARDRDAAPPISWSRGAGFVDYTVTRRFPKIASDVRAVLSDEPDRARQVEGLLDGIVAEARIDVTGLARPTPFWCALATGDQVDFILFLTDRWSERARDDQRVPRPSATMLAVHAGSRTAPARARHRGYAEQADGARSS